jgi:hypothetical protein
MWRSSTHPIVPHTLIHHARFWFFWSNKSIGPLPRADAKA